MAGGRAELTEAEISQRLARAQGRIYPHGFPPGFLASPSRPAAVLIPFLQHNGAWQILFTRRNPALPEHSGQVAFPGGRADPDDPDPETTALREAHEEIGLDPADVRILGRMMEFLTVTNYRIIPVVGVIPWPYPLRLARAEVSRAFTIPLAWLADPLNRAEHLRSLPPPHAPIPVIYFEPYDQELLWGVSAALTVTLLDILFDEPVSSHS